MERLHLRGLSQLLLGAGELGFGLLLPGDVGGEEDHASDLPVTVDRSSSYPPAFARARRDFSRARLGCSGLRKSSPGRPSTSASPRLVNGRFMETILPSGSTRRGEPGRVSGREGPRSACSRPPPP